MDEDDAAELGNYLSEHGVDAPRKRLPPEEAEAEPEETHSTAPHPTTAPGADSCNTASPSPAAPAFAAADFEVWPENEWAARLFLALQTQWQVGMAGATGLVYASIPITQRLIGVPPAKRADSFAGLRVLERETLAVWAEERERKK